MVIGKELKQLQDLRHAGDASWWYCIHKVISENVVERVLDKTGTREKRRRKLPAKIILLFVIAMGLFTEESMVQVYAAMIEGLRFLFPDLDEQMPKKGGSAKPAIVWDPNR